MRIPQEPIVCLGALEPSGYCSVRIRLTFKKRVDFYTGITVTPEQWDYSRQRVKHGCRVRGINYSTLNKLIQERLDFITDYCDEALDRKDETASAEVLKELYHARFMRSEKEQSNEFYFLLDKFIKEQNIDKNWSDGYHNQWKYLMKDLKDFAPNLTFMTISSTFMRSYVKYLSKRMSDDKIKNYLKKIKQFITDAIDNKYRVNPTFFDYQPVLKERIKEVNFLKEEELRRIINLDYSNQPSLDRVRDVFVFQCCTSLRFSDVSNLKRNNIRVNDEGQYEIRLITQKDKGEIWFPLSKTATRIYDKYKDNPYDGNKAFYVCSYTDFLKFLNKIGEDAQIAGETTTTDYRLGKEKIIIRKRSKIGTHDARRTFIVHALNGGGTFEQISQFTSHSEVEQMKPYINVTQKGKQSIIDIIDKITLQ